MKKNVFIILAILLFPFLAGCSTQEKSKETAVPQSGSITIEKQDVKEAVWNQLNSQDKGHIKGTWQDFKVKKITLREDMGIIYDKSYIGKEVYLIDFETDSLSVPRNRIVYASLDDNKLIGYGYVE